ncbi:hypothetical protein K8I85_13245 [bacterium]|nr:hypothetical protein [bacterium]
MKLSRFGRVVLGPCALVCLLCGPVAAADDWEAGVGEMGRTATRIALQIGGSWGAIYGTEVEKTNPATGFEVGASYRVFRIFSLYGGYASSKANIDGQLVELLDQPVRADGRSGNVSGDITYARYRTGIRIDAMRQKNWPAQIYFLGAAVFSTNKVAIESVDHEAPAPVPAPGGGTVDLTGFEDSQIGFLGRVAVEYRFAPRIGTYLGFSYEVFEAPPGTNSTTALSGGLVFRI